MTAVQITNVTVRLPNREKPLFHIPRLEIRQGEKMLLQGPSGSGKTTFLHLIAGLLFPSDGSILIEENNLRFLSDNQRCALRRSVMGLVFQKLNLLDHLTALENVQIVIPGPRRMAREKALKSLAQLQLTEVAHLRSAQLSLGEQQRVAVARILAQEPRLVLADEPTSSLDDINAGIVIEEILKLPKSPTLIVVSHDGRLGPHFPSPVPFSQWVPQ
jgi:ABC-type lipoprotein export system ATPase subunit